MANHARYFSSLFFSPVCACVLQGVELVREPRSGEDPHGKRVRERKGKVREVWGEGGTGRESVPVCIWEREKERGRVVCVL
jgi:hypothetical protein